MDSPYTVLARGRKIVPERGVVRSRKPQTTVSSLQRVLHAAARMVLNLRPCDHVTPALLELHWLPIAERIDFKLCLLVHKALVGHAPQYIADLISLSGQWLICHPEPHCGQRLLAICMCHEHVEGSETERLPLWPHACGIVYLLTSNFTGRRQHLSNAVLKRFYLTGASLNMHVCKWLCNALPVF